MAKDDYFVIVYKILSYLYDVQWLPADITLVEKIKESGWALYCKTNDNGGCKA